MLRGFKESVSKIFLNRRVDQDTLNEFEELLIKSDIDIDTAEKIIKKLELKRFGENFIPENVQTALEEIISEILTPCEKKIEYINSETPFVLLVMGVNGSGKTTTIAKIANKFIQKNKKVLLVAADTFRAAASEQLEEWSKNIHADILKGEEGSDPASIVFKSVEDLRLEKYGAIIIDTAGRLHIDENLMDELEAIISKFAPHETLYVIDGMTGQDAVNSSKLFSEKINLSGVIITKMDGDSGGGVALSVKEVTNCPIKFITSGESINDIEAFNSNRIAKRILGLTDIVGLVEKAQKTFDEESAKKLEQKIIKNEFDFNDFSDQLKQFNKLGSMTELAKFVPGVKNINKLNVDEKQFKWIEAIINSMTKKERINPSIINGSRRARIAKGAGRSVNEVNRLIKQFNQLKIFMKKNKKMNFGKFPLRFN